MQEEVESDLAGTTSDDDDLHAPRQTEPTSASSPAVWHGAPSTMVVSPSPADGHFTVALPVEAQEGSGSSLHLSGDGASKPARPMSPILGNALSRVTSTEQAASTMTQESASFGILTPQESFMLMAAAVESVGITVTEGVTAVGNTAYSSVASVANSVVPTSLSDSMAAVGNTAYSTVTSVADSVLAKSLSSSSLYNQAPSESGGAVAEWMGADEMLTDTVQRIPEVTADSCTKLFSDLVQCVVVLV